MWRRRSFAAYTPLDGFQIFLERILRPINQMNAYCICFAVLFNWMNRFGMRITALEKKIEEIERHVMIDIDTP
jgi:Mg2+ and Co2+ transporter CorA